MASHTSYHDRSSNYSTTLSFFTSRTPIHSGYAHINTSIVMNLVGSGLGRYNTRVILQKKVNNVWQDIETKTGYVEPYSDMNRQFRNVSTYGQLRVIFMVYGWDVYNPNQWSFFYLSTQ